MLKGKFQTVEKICSIRQRVCTRFGPAGRVRPQFNAEMTGKSKIREPIIQNFVRSFRSDFSFFRLFEGAPLSVGHAAQVIKCPEYPSDPSLKVSATESKSRCFNFANVANPFLSALPSDFFELGSKEIRSTERPQAALINFFPHFYVQNVENGLFFAFRLIFNTGSVEKHS